MLELLDIINGLDVRALAAARIAVESLGGLVVLGLLVNAACKPPSSPDLPILALLEQCANLVARI